MTRQRRPIDVLRERQGGISKGLKEYFATQQRLRKAIDAALAGGPRTIPEIASVAGLPPPEVVWHLMAMRRYGEVVDGPERDGYVLYRLKGA
jgi:hypothetical protein